MAIISVVFITMGVFGIIMGLLKNSKFYLGSLDWGKEPESRLERQNKRITSIITGIFLLAIGSFLFYKSM